MQRAIIIRGKLSDPRHVELDEPVVDMQGEVEVVLRSVANDEGAQKQNIVDYIATLRPGTRSKEDIDAQLAEERGSWGDR